MGGRQHGQDAPRQEPRPRQGQEAHDGRELRGSAEEGELSDADSLASRWTYRELCAAEQAGRPIVPIWLAGEFPARLGVATVRTALLAICLSLASALFREAAMRALALDPAAHDDDVGTAQLAWLLVGATARALRTSEWNVAWALLAAGPLTAFYADELLQWLLEARAKMAMCSQLERRIAAHIETHVAAVTARSCLSVPVRSRGSGTGCCPFETSARTSRLLDVVTPSDSPCAAEPSSDSPCAVESPSDSPCAVDSLCAADSV